MPPKFVLLTIIAPLVLGLGLGPLWFVIEPYKISGVHSLIVVLVIPAYLCLIGIRWLPKTEVRNWPGIAALLLSVVLAGNCIQYIFWGISSARLTHPDAGTLMLMKAQVLVGIGVLVAPLLVAASISVARARKL